MRGCREGSRKVVYKRELVYVCVVYNCEYSELETSLALSSAGVPDLRSAVVLEFQRDLNFPVSVSLGRCDGGSQRD